MSQEQDKCFICEEDLQKTTNGYCKKKSSDIFDVYCQNCKEYTITKESLKILSNISSKNVKMELSKIIAESKEKKITLYNLGAFIFEAKNSVDM